MATVGRPRFSSTGRRTSLDLASNRRRTSPTSATRPGPQRNPRAATPWRSPSGQWAADPPDLSFFSVACTKPPDPVSEIGDFEISPYVVGAEGCFVLLRVRFISRFRRAELFMYTAAGDTTESPSLERIPLPGDDIAITAAADHIHILGVEEEFGIVPRGLHYLVAALCDAPDGSLNYRLHIYSSESKTWSSKTLQNTMAKRIRIRPEKVITLGEGVLGWVDFSHGLLLVCNLCQEPPSVCFIPLPKPLPANRDRLRLPGASPRLFRDLACVDGGKLKFIEMEHLEHSDPCDDEDVLYDSDLIRLLESMDKPKARHGWKAVTWSRTVSSNCWCKERNVDVADILDDESAAADSSLLSGLRGQTVGKLKFRDLHSVFPTLSIDKGDILYLMSAAEPNDQNRWVVTVDLGNKTVKALGAYPFKNYDPTEQAFRTSTLSRHLVITPGIKVEVYHKITQVAKSANKPNELIHVDKRVSWKPKHESKRMMLERIQKLKRILDERHISIQNDQSRMKQQRLSAEETTLSPNKAQSIVYNDHISQIHPVQNNLPPQQCFNPDQPFYLGYSSYPQQNKLLQQQCFSMMNGFCGYAPLAPTPVLHGYGNYQPLWHQPSQWQQQQQPQPSSEFQPHKASQPCFNEHNGASCHGYLQQLPAHNNSFAYGAHSVYGNNQQQGQSRPPIYNLPASGSWQQPPAVQHQLTPSGV